MSKTSLCIRMLGILYSRDIVSVSELADLLETNPRNIPEYKKELEAAGYYIESYPGRYGGYSLEKSMLFPTVRLTEKEKDGLMADICARETISCRSPTIPMRWRKFRRRPSGTICLTIC